MSIFIRRLTLNPMSPITTSLTSAKISDYWRQVIFEPFHSNSKKENHSSGMFQPTMTYPHMWRRVGPTLPSRKEKVFVGYGMLGRERIFRSTSLPRDQVPTFSS